MYVFSSKKTNLHTLTELETKITLYIATTQFWLDNLNLVRLPSYIIWHATFKRKSNKKIHHRFEYELSIKCWISMILNIFQNFSGLSTNLEFFTKFFTKVGPGTSHTWHFPDPSVRVSYTGLILFDFKYKLLCFICHLNSFFTGHAYLSVKTFLATSTGKFHI